MLVAAAMPVLIVTHDPLEAMALAQRIIVMKEGVIKQQGTVEEVFSRPSNLEVARIVGIETVQRGEVLSQADGLATLRVGAAILRAETREPITQHVNICIRGEDVVLFRNVPDQPSARNLLTGTVVTVLQEGPLARVMLDCGFPLTALISKQARHELNITEGDQLTALIKASAIHVLPA